jgi:hypothetical protein
MRPSACALAAALSTALASPDARAVERQLQLSLRPGFSWSSGPHGGPGTAVDLGAVYGLNDAFSVYANANWSVAFPSVARNSPRHGASLSAGVIYAFDYLRVVPYLGLGARGDLMVGPQIGWWGLSAEARVGAMWLVKRSFALDLQAAYAFPFFNRDLAGDLLTVTAGAALLFDL